MKSLDIYLNTEDETTRFGIALGKAVRQGDVICLDGDLGSGKTTLTKAIAIGLEVEKEYYVTSPTFNIFQEYPGRIQLYHMDFYRLGNSDDVADMGLDEYFFGTGVTVIEWSEKALDILPEEKLAIRLRVTAPTRRVATCGFAQASWQERIERLSRNFNRAE